MTEQIDTRLTYEELGLLVKALRTDIEQYEKNAAKYRFAKVGSEYYVPNYNEEIYKPQRKEMVEKKDYYLNLRQQIRDSRKKKK